MKERSLACVLSAFLAVSVASRRASRNYRLSSSHLTTPGCRRYSYFLSSSSLLRRVLQKEGERVGDAAAAKSQN